MIFQEGFSARARSMIVAPVIMIASGNAPSPIIEIASRTGPVILSSMPSVTRMRAMTTAMIGPLTSCFQGIPVPPETSITPIDQIAASTPRLWTKRRATAELPKRISTTRTAVKPKFWHPDASAKVRLP